MGDENRSPLADISPRVTYDQPTDYKKITSPHLTTKENLVESDQKKNFEVGSPHEDWHKIVDGKQTDYQTSGGQKKIHRLNSGNEDEKRDNPPLKRHKTRRGKSKKARWNQEINAKSKERRANRTRPKRISQADAPYNTTQFIIEDHGWMHLPSPEYEPSFSESSDKGDFFSSPEDEESVHINNRFSDEFQELCRNVRAEKIHQLSKFELEQEYFKLEDRVERLEHEIRELKKRESSVERTLDSKTAITPNKSPEDDRSAANEDVFTEEIQSFNEAEETAISKDS